MEDAADIRVAIKLIVVIAILLHIRNEARRIHESWRHLILPVFFFWWLVYPLWLFLWPGIHRPSRRGLDPQSYLPLSWARYRMERKRDRRKPARP